MRDILLVVVVSTLAMVVILVAAAAVIFLIVCSAPLSPSHLWFSYILSGFCLILLLLLAYI